jgi:hypothetical protein
MPDTHACVRYVFARHATPPRVAGSGFPFCSLSRLVQLVRLERLPLDPRAESGQRASQAVSLEARPVRPHCHSLPVLSDDGVESVSARLLL